MALGEGIVQATILTLFATVDIVPAVDANGKDIPVAGGTTGKLLEYVPSRSPYYLLKADISDTFPSIVSF